ncbi:MAG: replication factor A [Halobacteriales archaeon SW_9_67_25]|nr:MAG: replication factor A [Halobacteriales archaeon SW_9_67_25]
MSLEDQAEDLASDLGVDTEEVKRDLENLVSYSVPMDEAKQSLRRKYGEDTGSGGETPTTRDVADVTTGDSNVSVTGVLLTVGQRSIQYQGEEIVIFEGELADETGKISYTAWEDFGLEPGITVRVGNAGVREWEGDPELNLGESTSVELVEDSLDVAYDVGGDRELAGLSIGDRGVNVEGLVQDCETKVIDGRDGETEILSGVLADGSGRLPFTDWDPHETIETGESVRVENAFVREFRGVPSVNVSEFSTVRRLDGGVEATDSAQQRTVRAAVESGGLFDVELVGTVIDLRDGSGLIERCPACGRLVQNGQCRSHGEVDAEDDLRTKAILDDGTGTVTVVLGEDLTEEVYGGGVADAKEAARDAMDREVVADAIAGTVVGREFRVRGSLSVDDYGANLDARSFAATTDDPAERARALLAEVGG